MVRKHCHLIFVDVEANGPCPGCGEMTEFGAVHYESEEWFYADLRQSKGKEKEVFQDFADWLVKMVGAQPVFVSDNPAFDWQWCNWGFHHYLGRNPFGWSARRISDYFAGLTGNFWDSQRWKRWRITKHDHNPYHDALGNVQAFKRIERDKDIIRGINP